MQDYTPYAKAFSNTYLHVMSRIYKRMDVLLKKHIANSVIYVFSKHITTPLVLTTLVSSVSQSFQILGVHCKSCTLQNKIPI